MNIWEREFGKPKPYRDIFMDSVERFDEVLAGFDGNPDTQSAYYELVSLDLFCDFQALHMHCKDLTVDEALSASALYADRWKNAKAPQQIAVDLD